MASRSARCRPTRPRPGPSTPEAGTFGPVAREPRASIYSIRLRPPSWETCTPVHVGGVRLQTGERSIIATQVMTRRRGGTSLMSPGTRRTFVLVATLALAGSALAGPAMAQDEANIDDLMFGSNYAPEKGTPGGSVVIADWQILTSSTPTTYRPSSTRRSSPPRTTSSGTSRQTSSTSPSWPSASPPSPTAASASTPSRRRSVRTGAKATRTSPASRWISTSDRASSGSDGETLDLNDYKYTMVDWMMESG